MHEMAAQNSWAPPQLTKAKAQRRHVDATSSREGWGHYMALAELATPPNQEFNVLNPTWHPLFRQSIFIVKPDMNTFFPCVPNSTPKEKEKEKNKAEANFSTYGLVDPFSIHLYPPSPCHELLSPNCHVHASNWSFLLLTTWTILLNP